MAINRSNRSDLDARFIADLKNDTSDYWDRMMKRHPNKKIGSADQLWKLACMYCKQTDTQREMVSEMVRGGSLAGQIMEVPKDRPYSWQAFEVFLREEEIINSLADYKSNKNGNYDDYAPVIRDIENLFFANTYEGAQVGKYESGVSTRMLGLAEKKDVTVVEQPLFGELTDDDE